MRRLLLDTHVLVWCLSDVPRLEFVAHRTIANPRNHVFVSAITAWEIAANVAKGRMKAPDNVAAEVEERGFTHLPLTFRHAEHAAQLPMHHRDPFDRFLIAQAQIEGLTIVTRDARIPLYGVRTMQA